MSALRLRFVAQRTSTLFRPTTNTFSRRCTIASRSHISKAFTTSRQLCDTPDHNSRVSRQTQSHVEQVEAVQQGLPIPDAESQIPTPTPLPSHAPSSSSSSSSSASTTVTSNASSQNSSRAGPLSAIVRAYDRNQSSHPYRTQFWTSILIYLCGDLSAQLLFGGEDEEGQMKAYDPWRTMRHLTVGAVSSIPSFKWFMFLHHNFNYSSKFASVLTKVVVQQIVFTPVFNTYFFGMHSLLSGSSLEETIARIRHALPSSLMNSVKLWPVVTFVNFWYLAPQYRSVFAGVVAVGWQSYLSWLNVRAAREVKAEEAAGALKEKESSGKKVKDISTATTTKEQPQAA